MATPYQWYTDNRLAELRMLQGLATAAQTNGSPQVRALMEMMARNVFGAEGLDSMAPGDIQLMQYALGLGIDNGLIPYVDDGARSFESLYQMSKATGQFRGMDMEDRGLMTYALHQRMQAAIYAPDGSTNYTFTGGLDGNMASQLYTELMRRELASGRTRLRGQNVGMAQGATYAVRLQSMLENARNMQASGEITSSELMRYESAARSANRELGTETAVQYKLLDEMRGRLTLTEADEALKARYGDAGLLQSENVLNQLAAGYNDIKDKEAFNRGAVSFYAARREDEVDKAVMRKAVLDSRQGKKTRILGLDAIQDASVGEVLLGVGDGSLASYRMGSTVGVDRARRDGESLGDFMKRVLAEAAESEGNGGGTTSESMAELRSLAGVYGSLEEQVRKRKGKGAVVTDADIREEIVKAYGGEDYKNVDRTFIEGVRKLEKTIDEGIVSTEVLQQGTGEMDSKAKELFERYGRTIRSLQDIFGTDNLKELQRNLDELHWGSVTSAKDLGRISENLDSVLGMAQMSGRSAQSVMLERKALAKALSAMSGGDSYVSDGEINMIQIALQELDRARQSGSGAISKEEATAKMKRSVDNALSKDNFGGAAAARGILESRPDLFSDSEAASFREEIAAVDRVLNDPNSTPADRDAARMRSRVLWARLREYGISESELRRAAVKYGEDYGASSPYNGLVIGFREKIGRIGPDGNRIFDDNAVAGASEAFGLALKALGNADPGRFREFRQAVEKGSVDEYLSAHPELAGSEGDLRRAAELMRGLNKQQMDVFSSGMTSQDGAIVLGAGAVRQHRMSVWDAFVQASADTSGNVRRNPADGLFGGFIRGLLNGDEASVTAESAVLNDMWDQIYGPNRKSYAQGGATIEERVRAMNDMFSTERGRRRYGKGATALEVYDTKTGLSASAYEAGLRNAGYTDEEIAAEIEEYNKLGTPAERGLRARDKFAAKGYQVGIGDGVFYIMDSNAARAAAVEDERNWKALSSLDFSEALKDDGIVSKEELMKALGEQNFDSGGVYNGPLDMLRGKMADQLVDANNRDSFNYKGNEGDRSLAQRIEDKRTGHGAVDTIATDISAMTGQFKSIYDLLKEWRNDDRRDREREAGGKGSEPEKANALPETGDRSWVDSDVSKAVRQASEQGEAGITSSAPSGDAIADASWKDFVREIRNVVVGMNTRVSDNQQRGEAALAYAPPAPQPVA